MSNYPPFYISYFTYSSHTKQDFSVWLIRSGRFGLSRFGLGRFGHGTFRSGSFWSGVISVTTFLYMNNLLHSFI